MFKRLLIANRGEIARRIIHTARALGLETVAVYADPDAQALHVREADQAFALGGERSADSYLRVERLLEAARATGADAVHPGYGFLSENADFAQAVLDAGLHWIGPPPEAIRALGSKAGAKALALAHGVPCLPGYAGEGQRPERGPGRLRRRPPADRAGPAAATPCRAAGVCRPPWPRGAPGRARLLGAAAPPEDHRRSPQPRRGPWPASAHGRVRRGPGPGRRLCGRGHGGVSARRRRLLPDGDEHPAAGGAPCDRGPDRAGPGRLAAARGPGRAPAPAPGADPLRRPCHRGSPVRRRRALPPPHRPGAGLCRAAGGAAF